jgi:hypothetical protein
MEDKYLFIIEIFKRYNLFSFCLIFRGRNFYKTELAESRLWRKYEIIIKKSLPRFLKMDKCDSYR